MTKYTQILFCFIIIFLNTAKAQADKTSTIYKTILSRDSLLFSVGFNTCDFKQMENLLSDQLEFYHDKDGISDKKKFMTDFRNGLCKSPETYRAKRALISNSTQIYPMYKNGELYAVIQNGAHQFYESINHQPEQLVGSAQFTNFWFLENGNWRLRKSLSFDHQAKQASEDASSENDQDIEDLLKKFNIPTLGLGIIEGSELKQIKVFGEIKKDVSAPYNTYFNVASLTKPVTAMVALRLISLGKWKLDEPLASYWTDPDIAHDPRHKKLTTRLILSHQTGFPNWRWMNPDKKLSFQFDPGTKYQYSGEGFEYLKKALESKFRKTLDQLAKELIFEPLKMGDTNYVWDKNTDESRFAIGYNKESLPYPVEKTKTANAADDLHTTIEDYGNFIVSVMKGSLLKRDIFQEMIKRQVKTKENKYFGLGFEIYDLGNGEYALAHGGADLGTRCIAIVLPKSGKGILIFTNTDDGYKVYEKLAIHYLGEQGKKIAEIENK
ncbi:serine hydrolase [Chryseobacterium sp. 2987]|uniref:serine hydrolase n=1 Tax=Chryseobacterium sp. 2987 TaxID=2817767 RepID=UPI00285DE48A|nr:serine hydrolase [Chryseobacterium sp. 2987]MDR6919594.1 CubicO group peptidase (beta-lactamase class C family) [Chryseobacterium sp. 2987]